MPEIWNKFLSITKARDSIGFEECKSSAKRGGEIAKNARLELEQETNQKVVSKTNYLELKIKKIK